jgi:hypothetical protein
MQDCNGPVNLRRIITLLCLLILCFTSPRYLKFSHRGGFITEIVSAEDLMGADSSWDSIVVIVTHFGLDGSGFEPIEAGNHPRLQRVWSVFPGSKGAGEWH